MLQKLLIEVVARNNAVLEDTPVIEVQATTVIIVIAQDFRQFAKLHRLLGL